MIPAQIKRRARRRFTGWILFCSGMIAGEGIVGILLALAAVIGLDRIIDMSSKLHLSVPFLNFGGIIMFILIILTFMRFTLWKKR